MKKKIFAFIRAVGSIIGFLAFIFTAFAIQTVITDLRVKVSNIPNVLMHSKGFSLLSPFFEVTFIFCLAYVIELLTKLRSKDLLLKDIRKPLIIMVACIIGIYSNFWAISKDKIYVSSITTLGFSQKYDYKDVSNISINVNAGKSRPTIDVELNVKGHKLSLEQGDAEEEVEKKIITVLRTKYNVPVSVNKHGHEEYDGKIEYLLDN